MIQNVDLTEIINMYNEYILKIENGCLYIAEKLREEDKECLNSIIDFSEGIEWIIIANEEISKNNIQTYLDKDLLIRYLENINEAIEKNDLFLIADLFEYEIAEYFKNPALIEG